MTKPDHTSLDDDAFDAKAYFLHLIGWSVLLALALLALCVAIIAGIRFTEAPKDDYLVMMAVGLPISLIGSYFLWRWMPDFTMGEPQTPRGKRVRWILIGCGVLGGLSSVPLIDLDQGGTLLFGNGPVPPLSALITGAMWTLIMPVFMIGYRLNSDEVTREANNFGFSVGFQAFAYIAPLWWLGWRGGFLPQPDVMVLFLGGLVVATIAHLWKRLA
ncbi:MAG: hypothetical protein AAGH57_05550 [Pseudomonadota bacterium]